MGRRQRTQHQGGHYRVYPGRAIATSHSERICWLHLGGLMPKYRSVVPFLPPRIYKWMPYNPKTGIAAVIPTFSLHFSGFDTLAVDDRRAGFDFTACCLAHTPTQSIVYGFPDAFLAPGVEVTIDRLPRGKVVGQHAPGATTSQDIENGIDDFPHINASATTSRFGWWNERFQDEMLNIGQITGICFSVHAPIMPERGWMHSLYITFKTPS